MGWAPQTQHQPRTRIRTLPVKRRGTHHTSFNWSVLRPDCLKKVTASPPTHIKGENNAMSSPQDSNLTSLHSQNEARISFCSANSSQNPSFHMIVEQRTFLQICRKACTGTRNMRFCAKNPKTCLASPRLASSRLGWMFQSTTRASDSYVQVTPPHALFCSLFFPKMKT